MAAGLGFKTFNTGDVLSAADVNGYLMQGVWVFANATARTSAVTSPQEGNVSFLRDTNSLEIYDGAAWVAYGAGDITEVAAGIGISGGGTSGAVTITNSMATAIDAKGDLVAGTGADAFTRIAVGSNGQVLIADSSTATGLRWGAAAGTYGTVLATGTLSGASLDLQSISGIYKDLILEVYNPFVASAGQMLLRINNESGAATHGHVFMKTNDVSLTAANGTSINSGIFAAGSNNNTSFARFIIPDYAATTHRKTVYWNGTDTVDNRSYWGTGWRNNSSDAINRLTLFVNGQNWSGGTYNLYGVN